MVIILASLFMLGMAVKVTKEHYNTGTDQIILIGSNADVVNFMRDWMRMILNLQVRLILILQELMSLNRSRKSEKRLLKKIINKRNELGEFNALEDLMLVPGICNKTFEKLLSYI